MSERTSQINRLLLDLERAAPSNAQAASQLLELKELAKHPSGSAILASGHNLTLLLSFATQKYKDNAAAKSEALRSIANCLLLVDAARLTFVDASDLVVVGEEVSGGRICLAELEKPNEHTVTFVLARILFLCTVHQSQALADLVEKYDAIRIVSAKLDELTAACLAGKVMAKEAMVDLLKFAFNLLMHYPKMAGDAQDPGVDEMTPQEQKVIGDFWSDKLDGILPSLLMSFSHLSPEALDPAPPPSQSETAQGPLLTRPARIKQAPLEPPLTHVLHSLITIPINPGLKPIWFPSPPSSKPSYQGPSKKPRSKEEETPKASSSSPPRSSTSASRSSSESRSASPMPGASIKGTSTLDRALSVLTRTRRSLSRSPTHESPTEPNNTSLSLPTHKVDVLAQAFSLLDGTMEFYLPGDVDPDETSVRDRLKAMAPPPPPGTVHSGPDHGSLDDPVSPLVLLLSRLCLADPTCRRRLRSWLVPKDLDRSEPLETHNSLLGRLLRLLSSVYHSRTKDAAGEMLFAMCNSDASTFSALLGYGNVAGFLFNKGIMSAPPAPDGGDESIPELPDSDDINPITGSTQKKDTKVQDEMTDEEKEREMEKMFVLFDRLERNGAITAENNPVRGAIHKAMAS